jgi:hypothetical protein
VADQLTVRFTSPAHSPLQDCSSYSHVHIRRERLGFVHRSRIVFLPPQTQACVPIRNALIAVSHALTAVAVSHAPFLRGEGQTYIGRVFHASEMERCSARCNRSASMERPAPRGGCARSISRASEPNNSSCAGAITPYLDCLNFDFAILNLFEPSAP